MSSGKTIHTEKVTDVTFKINCTQHSEDLSSKSLWYTAQHRAHKKSAYEEDIHQCGRCKVVFNNIDDYFQHKKAKTCMKVKIAPNHTETQNYESKQDVDCPVSSNIPNQEVQISTDAEILDAASVLKEMSELHQTRELAADQNFADQLIALKEVDEQEVVSAVNLSMERSTKEDCAKTEPAEVVVSGVVDKIKRRSSRRSTPKKAWVEDYTAENAASENVSIKREREDITEVQEGRKRQRKIGMGKKRGPKRSQKSVITQGLVAIVEDKHLLGLDDNMQEDDGEEPETLEVKECPSCSYIAINQKDHDDHLRNSHSLSVYVCKKCHQAYPTKDVLVTHEEMNKCEEVDEEVPEFGVLKTKQRVKRTNVRKPNFESFIQRIVQFCCFACEDDYETFEGIIQHVKEKHTDINPAICPFCNHWFSQKVHLTKHLDSSVHANVKQAEIVQAQKRVVEMDDDIQWNPSEGQEREHSSTVKLLCTMCCQTFKDRASFYKHWKQVHGKKAYPCQTCTNVYSTKDKLRKHLVHHGHQAESIQACEICDKNFYQRSHLARHMEAMHWPKLQLPETVIEENVSKSFEAVTFPEVSEENTLGKRCFVCHQRFMEKREYCRHMEQHKVWFADPVKGSHPPDLIMPFQSDACGSKVRKVMAQRAPRGHKGVTVGDEDGEGGRVEEGEKEEEGQGTKELSNLMNMLQQMNQEFQISGKENNENEEVPKEDNIDKTTEPVNEEVEDGNNSVDDKCAVVIQPPTENVQQKENMQTIPNTERFLCAYCFDAFSSLEAMYKHKITTHQLVLKWTCNHTYECETIFDDLMEYEKHHEDVHSQMSFVCNSCNDHYPSMACLTVHKTTSHRYLSSHIAEGTTDHKCPHCAKFFLNSAGLQDHVTSEHKERVCKKCNEKFYTVADLRKHLENVCPADHLCDQCGQVFTTGIALSKHRLRHDSSRTLTCEVCSREFHKREHLRRHFITKHSDEKPFICSFEGCKRAFKRRDKMIDHEKCHTNAKPYKCPICGRAYRYREGLRYHEKTHGRNETHECYICNLPFSRPGQLRSHLSSEHSVNMKSDHIHKCTKCDLTFARPERLKRHMEREHDLAPEWAEQCDICKKGFSGLRSLDTHMKTRHEPPHKRDDSGLAIIQEIEVIQEEDAYDNRGAQMPNYSSGLTLTQEEGELMLVTQTGDKIPLKQIRGQPVELQGQQIHIPGTQIQLQDPPGGPRVQIQGQQVQVQGQSMQLQDLLVQGQQVQVQGQQLQIQGHGQNLQVQDQQLQLQGQSVQVQGQQVQIQGQHIQVQKQHVEDGDARQSAQSHDHMQKEQDPPDEMQLHVNPQGPGYAQDFVVETTATQEILVTDGQGDTGLKDASNLSMDIQMELQQQINHHMQLQQQQQQQQQQTQIVQQHFEPANVDHLENQQFQIQQVENFPGVKSDVKVESKSQGEQWHDSSHRDPGSHTQQFLSTPQHVGQAFSAGQLISTVLPSSGGAHTIKFSTATTSSAAQNIVIPLQISGGQIIHTQQPVRQQQTIANEKLAKSSSETVQVSIMPSTPAMLGTPLTSFLGTSFNQQQQHQHHHPQQQQITKLTIPMSELAQLLPTYPVTSAAFTPVMVNVDPVIHPATVDVVTGNVAVTGQQQQQQPQQQQLQQAGLQTITIQNTALQ